VAVKNTDKDRKVFSLRIRSVGRAQSGLVFMSSFAATGGLDPGQTEEKELSLLPRGAAREEGRGKRRPSPSVENTDAAARRRGEKAGTTQKTNIQCRQVFWGVRREGGEGGRWGFAWFALEGRGKPMVCLQRKETGGRSKKKDSSTKPFD